MHNHNSTAKTFGEKLGRFRFFSVQNNQEELCLKVKKLVALFFVLTQIPDFLELVFDFATKYNIYHPFEYGKAGDD